MDRQAERYSPWSPYNYVLNNPIISIDPDGEKVEFLDKGKDKRESKRYFRKLRRNSQSFRKAWRAAKRDDNTLFIRKRTEEEGSLVDVVPADENGDPYELGEIPDSQLKNEETPGVGANALIRINPIEDEETLNLIGMGGPEGFLGAHEFFHGLEKLTGNNFKGDLNGNILKDTEERASHFENLVRMDLDQNSRSLRTFYPTKKILVEGRTIFDPKRPLSPPKRIEEISIPIKVNVLKPGFDYTNRKVRRKDARNIVRKMTKNN